jgi:hypothetical protein
VTGLSFTSYTNITRRLCDAALAYLADRLLAGMSNVDQTCEPY